MPQKKLPISSTSRNDRSISGRWRSAATDRGQRADLSGRIAEDMVQRYFEQKYGAQLLAARWRGQGGEIDLIFHLPGCIAFCEVKSAATADAALHSLRPAQIARIRAAASEYLAICAAGQLTEVRFDLAIVSGWGAVEVIAGALDHF